MGKWGWLISIVVIGMVLAIVVDQIEKPTEDEGQLFYPEFAAKLANLSGVAIRSAGGKVNLSQVAGSWQVSDRYGYPVDFKRLSSLLVSLADAKKRERKTSNPGNHTKLGVTPEAGHVITVSTPEGSLELIIGNASTNGTGTFVRLASEDQVWLIDAMLSVSSNPADWLATQLIRLPEADIQSIDLTVKNEATYRVIRDDQGELSLEALPKGRALRYSTVLVTLATAVAQLSVSDVALHDPDRWRAPSEAVYTLADGRELRLQTAAIADQYWLRVEMQNDIEDNSGTPISPSPVVAATTTEAFDYQIAQRTFEDLNQSLESLLEPLESE